jgi:hypothetical protein
MLDQHWSDDDLVDRLLGIGREDLHVESCMSCARRWESVRRKHEAMKITAQDATEGLYAVQRLAIRDRIEGRKPFFRLEVTPALAVVLLVLVILTALRPSPQKTSDEAVSDSGVFEDVLNVASSTEPGTVVPVRSLFEVQQ